MKFVCLFINKRTNERKTKEYSKEEIDKYLGEDVTDRAISRGETIRLSKSMEICGRCKLSILGKVILPVR